MIFSNETVRAYLIDLEIDHDKHVRYRISTHEVIYVNIWLFYEEKRKNGKANFWTRQSDESEIETCPS